MTASAALLDQLTIDDYARLAFSIKPLDPSDPNSTGFGQGGVYAGPLESAPDARPWHDAYKDPLDRQVTARARLVQVPVGKVFVRWGPAGRSRAGSRRRRGRGGSPTTWPIAS